MLFMPEIATVDQNKSVNSVGIETLRMLGNTLSTMSSYNVNKAPKFSMSNNSYSDSLDGWRSIAMPMSKMVKRVKHKRGSYIRKSSWTSSKVTSFFDDGHVWRKYGQKEIIDAKHKRNYYRCTHKFDQGCQATKKVQQIEGEPPKYIITYNRHHTCKNLLSATQIILDSINHMDTSILLSFESNGINNKEQVGSHSPSFTHQESKKALPSLGLIDNRQSLFDSNLPHNLIMSDRFGPSSLPTRLEHGDVISKGVDSPTIDVDHILETSFYSDVISKGIDSQTIDVDHILETSFCSENPFDYCELTNYNYSLKI